VIKGSATGIFYNTGQVCTAASRLYVHRKLYNQVVSGVAEIAKKTRLGPGLDTKAQMGPVVSERQMERVLGYIESGKQQGAEVLAGGGRADLPGYFVSPTVLSNTNSDMNVVREEIFGPVLSACPFDDLEEVAKMANDSIYGLGASIWSKDLSTVHRLIPRIRAGTVWVNTHTMIDPAMPFGGFKQSGIGREQGRAVLDLYTESKTVCMLV
jgi:phenylacetaldehyde dehydrogenase